MLCLVLFGFDAAVSQSKEFSYISENKVTLSLCFTLTFQWHYTKKSEKHQNQQDKFVPICQADVEISVTEAVRPQILRIYPLRTLNANIFIAIYMWVLHSFGYEPQILRLMDALKCWTITCPICSHWWGFLTTTTISNLKKTLLHGYAWHKFCCVSKSKRVKTPMWVSTCDGVNCSH